MANEAAGHTLQPTALVHEAWIRLGGADAPTFQSHAVDEKAEPVKLRYSVGMNFEDAAAALGIGVPTAKQWWAYSWAWLTIELRGTSRR
jgi:hypothetical protein